MVSKKNISVNQPTRSVEWYEQDVREVMKGIELEYTRNLKLVVNLDLSNNNLIGTIPEEITSLGALLGLNLSYNRLSGHIPKRIGDMKSLESLDLSHDQLSGAISESFIDESTCRIKASLAIHLANFKERLTGILMLSDKLW
ncbi:LRR receptor-like serine/threonine-protein kinase FLS2 [Vigna unguiculata]|uniref:LRR receptor-like serine/threonine-protein kinase FLS2 n=1 Tax=Vigna unguiculata TaxID=3917 RepID=A0A4D6MWG2_VIGUN|nr:LRR receptor-like serine/threonine-protein kinase FLS2 [Vigna unguiculata]